jgi:AraC-like DNA-binding protein
VGGHLLNNERLRIAVVQQGFSVKTLAFKLGLEVRTLQRRFRAELRTTPKIWIMRERMLLAPPLLREGLGNKQVADRLSYSCESNFCRDFKRYYGCAPQKFARKEAPDPAVPVELNDFQLK